MTVLTAKNKQVGNRQQVPAKLGKGKNEAAKLNGNETPLQQIWPALLQPYFDYFIRY